METKIEDLDLDGGEEMPDTTVAPELLVAIKADIRRKLVIEFQQARLQMKLFQKIENEQSAIQMQTAAQNILKMLKAIDDGEV